MKKSFLLGTIITLPIAFVLFKIFNPPQCPEGFTQEQVDASSCIVGVNIGGLPIFFVCVAAVWAVAVLSVRWVHKRRRQ